MDIASHIRRLRKKRILVLSAGSLHSGVQGIYMETSPQGWHVLASSYIPYSFRVKELLAHVINNPAPQLSLSEAAWFDRKLSYLFLDCSRTLLASVSKSNRLPTFVILNRLELWKGVPDAEEPQEVWLLLAGSAHLLATSLGAPVLTGFSRHGLLFTFRESLPLQAGIAKIALELEGEEDCAFLNIGLATRLFVVDRKTTAVVVDREAGPGMHLINLAAAECGCADGFDRDGLAAANGTIDNACVDALTAGYLAASEQASPVSLPTLTNMYHQSALRHVPPADRLATATALTARLAFQIYKKECPPSVAPRTLWIAGGGANNQTLRSFLSAYFHPVKLRSIDEIGIHPNLFFPAALGLSVQTWLDHEAKFWNPDRNPRPKHLGAWVMAQ